ncbi:MAG: tripartite tricarboxylate transporter permease [Desulfobacterales bacterium]|nr:tripartite tricarboxylate transporter permease [Desulfobacterales bacterium]
MFEVFEPALTGLISILELRSFIFLCAGVVLGTVGAILPGIGGPAQLAIVLPFVILMKRVDAIPFLIGMVAVGNTGNTFTSVLVSVPGGAGSQATVLDGFPMAKKGQAGRALSAAFMVSMIGGLIGAVILVLSLPILQFLIKLMGSPELFVLTLWGVAMIGTLSAGAPLKGLATGILGVLLAVVGMDQKTGVSRFGFGWEYLWGGISLAIISLSIFGIPEMIALASRRGSVTDVQELEPGGIMEGIRDSFRHWWLVLRCSAIGAWIGFLPGLGSEAAGWFAYAHAKQTEKDGHLFGTGDVRGVIAPEASNNAKEGGALIPTLAFGVPGSASLALLMVAFVILGVRPGPEMLTNPEQLAVTWSIVWSLIFSQILATALCLGLIKPTARVCFVPFFYLVPVVLALAFISSFAANYEFADLLMLVSLGVLGFFMKENGWPRAPVLLGFVLGRRMEMFLWASTARYGMEWLLRPGVILLLLLLALTVVHPFILKRRRARQAKLEP